MRELLVVEFRNGENKLRYAVIGVTAIELEKDTLLIKTENTSKNLRISEDPIKEKGLKLRVYYPGDGDIKALLGNKNMFEKGMQIIDGRIDSDVDLDIDTDIDS